MLIRDSPTYCLINTYLAFSLISGCWHRWWLIDKKLLLAAPSSQRMATVKAPHFFDLAAFYAQRAFVSLVGIEIATYWPIKCVCCETFIRKSRHSYSLQIFKISWMSNNLSEGWIVVLLLYLYPTVLIPSRKPLLIFTVHVAYKTYVKPTQMQSGESL